jgi:hypothetical protein
MALIKGNILLIALSTTLSIGAYSQNCSLVKVSDYPLSLIDSIKLGDVYRDIFNDSVKRYHIVLLRNAGEVPVKSLTYIKGDCEKFNFEYFENGILKKTGPLSNKTIDTIFKSSEIFNGYYQGECSKTGWGHIGEHLIIVDKQKKISAEFFAANEDLRNTLKTNALTNDLTVLYDLAMQIQKKK